MSLVISVELLCGTDIREAITEAKELCNKLEVAGVGFSFNGMEMFVTGISDVDSKIDEYHKSKSIKQR